MKTAMISASILVLPLVFYVTWQAEWTALQNLEKNYLTCKHLSEVDYSLAWLRQCNLSKPLDKECLSLLNQDYPWDKYAQFKLHIESEQSEAALVGYNDYKKYANKMNECSCDTLLEPVAEKLQQRLKDKNDSCLKEFEVLSRALR